MPKRQGKCLLCSGDAFSRNLCKSHYMIERRRGRLARYAPVLSRVSLESRIKKTPTCWLWIGDRTKFGYGVVNIGGRGNGRRRVVAHRFVYEKLVGQIPQGKIVMHICDNPPCVRPSHLRLGTIADNNRDTGDKLRHNYGLDHWNGRLSAEDIAVIRRSPLTQKVLAKKYGVCQPHISKIRTRKARTALT